MGKHMKFTKQITINASADKVWEVAGRKFADIGEWATGVSKSSAHNNTPTINSSPVGGRVCSTSFGEASEDFTAFDDAKKTFSFKGVFESNMFDKLINSLEVVSINENTSEVRITPEIDLKILGKLMYPMIKMNLSKAIDMVLSDMKYYVENGKPSASKLAAIAKQK